MRTDDTQKKELIRRCYQSASDGYGRRRRYFRYELAGGRRADVLTIAKMKTPPR
jgi:hypothetical protein